MLNLFKMEIYRALKSKVTAVTLLIMGAIGFIAVYIDTLGRYNDTIINICNEFTSILSSPMALILWAIMISVYISAEYKNGFVKSIAGQIPKRSYLVVTKVLLAVVYTIAMFIASFIFIAVSAFIFSRNNMVLGFESQMIKLWGVQFLLHVGFSCIYILIATLTRSSSFGIALGIFTGCGLTSLVYNGINWLVNKTGIVKVFSIGNYMIETNMKFMIAGITNEYVIRAALVSIVFIVVMMFISMKLLNKRDI